MKTLATLGAGCFWCTEAVFLQLQGVLQVLPGYMGGAIPNPSYRDVCTGMTGHAEVAQIEFDSTIISFEEILEVFWAVHDPTTPNRQGNDIGTQYRSVIFYHSPEQMHIANEYINQLDESTMFNAPIVTQVAPVSVFWKAEDYHMNYLELNPENAYCKAVVRPKVEKLKQKFAKKLKA